METPGIKYAGAAPRLIHTRYLSKQNSILWRLE